MAGILASAGRPAKAGMISLAPGLSRRYAPTVAAAMAVGVGHVVNFLASDGTRSPA